MLPSILYEKSFSNLSNSLSILQKKSLWIFSEKIISEVRSQNYPLGPWNQATGHGGRKKCPWKKKMPVKILKFLPVKPFFSPWKKNKKCPWNKNTRVKKVKKPEKNGREKQILPVKKTKNRQKKSFTPTFFFTPKKKNTVEIP